jgi:hypothetical protein
LSLSILLRTLQLVCVVFLPLCCSSEDPHLACSPTAASPDDTLWALAPEQLSLDLSIDRRGDNLGRWKEDTLGLNRAQIKFPGPTLAQVLQEMALHHGTIVQGIQKRMQLFIHFVYSNCHVFLGYWNNMGGFCPGLIVTLCSKWV